MLSNTQEIVIPTNSLMKKRRKFLIFSIDPLLLDNKIEEIDVLLETGTPKLAPLIKTVLLNGGKNDVKEVYLKNGVTYEKIISLSVEEDNLIISITISTVNKIKLEKTDKKEDFKRKMTDITKEIENNNVEKFKSLKNLNSTTRSKKKVFRSRKPRYQRDSYRDRRYQDDDDGMDLLTWYLIYSFFVEDEVMGEDLHFQDEYENDIDLNNYHLQQEAEQFNEDFGQDLENNELADILNESVHYEEEPRERVTSYEGTADGEFMDNVIEDNNQDNNNLATGVVAGVGAAYVANEIADNVLEDETTYSNDTVEEQSQGWGETTEETSNDDWGDATSAVASDYSNEDSVSDSSSDES